MHTWLLVQALQRTEGPPAIWSAVLLSDQDCVGRHRHEATLPAGRQPVSYRQHVLHFLPLLPAVSNQSGGRPAPPPATRHSFANLTPIQSGFRPALAVGGLVGATP